MISIQSRSKRFAWLGAALATILGSSLAMADEPGWTNRMIKSPAERAESLSTPIIERPYRPFHFYGNTVRRMHYRQNPLPLPRDFVETGRALPSFSLPPLPTPALPPLPLPGNRR